MRRDIAVIALGFLLGVAFTVGSNELHGPLHPENAHSSPDKEEILQLTERGSIEGRRTSVVKAVEEVAPAVVSITTEIPVQSPFRFFSTPTGTSVSQGSGVIIRTDGIVLTNAHVIDGALSIRVVLADNKSFEASVLGFDEDLDLAILQLQGATNLPTVPIGHSDDLMLGETVIAIGNPFGLGHTVTTGVVSSGLRTLEVATRVYQDYIQTDAGINPGNSGGPLLNIHGELIGINTAIRKDAENIGFAIPVDRAIKVAKDLLQYGTVRTPYLGVAVSDVGGSRFTGTPIEAGAVLVEDVSTPNIGLKVGDVILALNGRTIHSRADLNLRLAAIEPGSIVIVDGIRENETFSLDIAADTLPDISKEILPEILGLEVTPITTSLQTKYRLRTRNGLLAIKVSSTGSFARAQLREGDVILAVHGIAINSEKELAEALMRAKAAHRRSALLMVQRGPYRGHVEVQL